MSLVDTMLDRIGRRIADRLQTPVSGCEPFTPSDTMTLRQTLQPADVLLVDGNAKLATAIKYLTQSTWSHAALYVGTALARNADSGEPLTLVEANLGDGVVAVPLSKYACFNTRICRPVGLTAVEQDEVVRFAIARLGHKYDTRNIVDLVRYLLPTPPVPVRWRRRMIALGSGEPTRAICSTLIAQAFQSVRYPILPLVEREASQQRVESEYSREEILHIRHYSLFAPRDFDLSPYFQIVKPTIEGGFDHRKLKWADERERMTGLISPQPNNGAEMATARSAKGTTEVDNGKPVQSRIRPSLSDDVLPESRRGDIQLRHDLMRRINKP